MLLQSHHCRHHSNWSLCLHKCCSKAAFVQNVSYCSTVARNNLNPTEWGWTLTDDILVPVVTDQPVAPDCLLKMVSSGCKAGCGRTCSCRKVGLYCSTRNVLDCESSYSSCIIFYTFTLEPNTNRIRWTVADMAIQNYTKRLTATILDLVQPDIGPFNPPTPENPSLEPNMKWKGRPVAEIWVSEWVGFNGTSTQFRSLTPSLTRKADTESHTVKESRCYINLANAICAQGVKVCSRCLVQTCANIQVTDIESNEDICV